MSPVDVERWRRHRCPVRLRRSFYEVIACRSRGSARFVDANTIEITGSGNGESSRVTAERFVIATGSRPYHPPGLDFAHPRVLDSDTVLRYTGTPFGLTIYGAGVIGCEYASIFLNMGVKVTLVNTHERLLSFMDEEIAEGLSYHLRDQGCIIRHNEQFDHLEHARRRVRTKSEPASVRRAAVGHGSPATQMAETRAVVSNPTAGQLRAPSGTRRIRPRVRSGRVSGPRSWRARPTSRAVPWAPTSSILDATAR